MVSLLRQFQRFLMNDISNPILAIRKYWMVFVIRKIGWLLQRTLVWLKLFQNTFQKQCNFINIQQKESPRLSNWLKDDWNLHKLKYHQTSISMLMITSSWILYLIYLPICYELVVYKCVPDGYVDRLIKLG